MCFSGNSYLIYFTTNITPLSHKLHYSFPLFSVVLCRFYVCVTNSTLQSGHYSLWLHCSWQWREKQHAVRGLTVSISGLVFLYQTQKPQIKVNDFSQLKNHTLPHRLGPLSIAITCLRESLAVGGKAWHLESSNSTEAGIMQ